MRFSRPSVAALSLAALAFIAAGCGGSSSSSPTSSQASATSTSATPSSAGATTVSAAESPELGRVLVDSEGLTVYSFAKDSGTMSTCYGACEEAWPPVIATGEPAAGEGAMSAELGTTKRKDGTLQVTYAGHPLYTFFEDQGPGEANGNGLSDYGGLWNALDESGAPVAVSSGGEEEPAAEEESGGSSGYGY